MSKAYDLYSGATLGIISRIIDNPPIAEEILQQTFLKVWNKIDSYDASKSSFFTWLSTIARNTAIDKKRLKSYENQNKTDSLDSSVYANATVSEDQSALDVEKITKMLEPKYKIIIDKLYLEGYSQRDLAEELNIPVGTIKTRIRAAMNILRDKLKDEASLFVGVVLLILLMILCL